LFVGPNNSGKTSALEAISTFCRPLDPLEWLNTAQRREVKSSRVSQVDSLKWLFPQTSQSNSRALYRGTTFISGSGTFRLREAHATCEELQGSGGVDFEANSLTEPSETLEDENNGDEFSLPTDETRRGVELKLTARFDPQRPLLPKPELEERSETFTLWEGLRFATRTAPSEPYLPVATITPVSHRVEQIQVGRLTEATLGGVREDVLSAVKLFDPGVQDLQILSRQGIRPALFMKHKAVGLAPLSAFGDGERRVLSIALSLPLIKWGVLLIDEIETAIHVSALGKVFTWLVRACKSYQVQIFATTHSLEAVDALLEAESKAPAGLVVFRLGEEGGPAQRFSGDLLQRLRRERGLDVR
jgi:hypothetical protein